MPGRKSDQGDIHTALKMKFYIKDFSSKCDQIHIFLWIWSYLLEKAFMENFIFCAVSISHASADGLYCSVKVQLGLSEVKYDENYNL